MNEDRIYQEKVASIRTGALFTALMILFFVFLMWRIAVAGFDTFAAILMVFFGFFLFCVLNYRTLIIHLTPESLILRFGVITWKVPLDNIEDCRLDEVPLFMRMGGAGVHFMFIRKRYRASFNFLEYPRVVISLKKKAGPVQEISFSTRQPDEVIRLIQNAAALRRDA